MAGFNTATLTKNLFNYVDPQVMTPKKGDLVGRTLFQVNSSIPERARTYTYFWKERMGEASDTTNRATDTTTVDVNYHEEIGYITEKEAAFDYSDDELKDAQVGHYDLIGDKTQAVHDALMDWEDKVIFNGIDDSKHPIYGLTSDPDDAGYQTFDKAPVTFDKVVDPTNTDAYGDATKLINWFLDAADKIKLLPGYTNAQPILALPPKMLSLLKRPYNQYSPRDTVYNMLQDPGEGSNSAFSKIVAVPEFEAQYWNTKKGADGKKDMGMIFINDPATANIPVAMNPQRDGAIEYTNKTYRAYYRERFGGLCVKFPAGFVRLDGIN